jgi:spermidine/putrescine transport system permease protein
MAFLHAAGSKVSSLKEKKSLLPYLLLAPGIIWLFTFFVLPIANLARTSTQTPVANGDTGSYEQTFRFANYIDAFIDNKEQFSRSFIYAFLATVLALAIAYPWRRRTCNRSSSGDTHHRRKYIADSKCFCRCDGYDV